MSGDRAGKRFAAGILCAALLSMTGNAAYINAYTNKNGLPTSNVNDSCQTTDGYIWAAQYEGLSRFDGSTFQYINSVEADGKTISLEQLTSVAGDDRNQLFIGTKNSGVFCMRMAFIIS